jgi:hypothetical protein
MDLFGISDITFKIKGKLIISRLNDGEIITINET